MTADSIAHICAAVEAARRRWIGRPFTVRVGQREYAAMQRELTYKGRVLGHAPADCPRIDTFMGYPLTVSAQPYGVWVEPA